MGVGDREYVIGVDGGASKTVCVVVNQNGEIIGRGEAGDANYQTIGIDAALNSIFTAIKLALNIPENTGINSLSFINSRQIQEIKIQEINTICLGLAGVSREDDINLMQQRFWEDFPKFYPQPILNPLPRLLICHDAMISLVGGIGNNVGIVVAAGTGAIAFGRNALGETKRVGGWGYLLGDEGSAYSIAIAGLKAVMRSYDGRGEKTALLAVFKNHLQLDNMEDLIPIIYRQGWGVKKIAALAPIIDQVATTGDFVANQIIDRAVKELILATITVINSLFLGSGRLKDNSINNRENLLEKNLLEKNILEIVTTGSVWNSQSQLRQRYINQLEHQLEKHLIKPNLLENNSLQINIIEPRHEPAYGASLIALSSFPTI